MKAFFSWLFTCHHHNVSRVFTIKRRTYQVCFDCGAELSYSWDRMCRTQTSELETAHAETPMDAMYRDSGKSIGPPQDFVARVASASWALSTTTVASGFTNRDWM